jgi:hypothetical protein
VGDAVRVRVWVGLGGTGVRVAVKVAKGTAGAVIVRVGVCVRLAEGVRVDDAVCVRVAVTARVMAGCGVAVDWSTACKLPAARFIGAAATSAMLPTETGREIGLEQPATSRANKHAIRSSIR